MGKLSELRTQEAKLMADIELMNYKLMAVRDEISGTRSRMRYFKKKEIHVSDHALVRYLERVCGLDTDKLRNEIISDNVVMGVRLAKSGRFSIRKGLMAVVSNNVVVTTYEV